MYTNTILHRCKMDIDRNLLRTEIVPVSEVMLSFLFFCCLMLALIDYYKEKNG